MQYFFIGSAALSLVGCIVCAVAKNVNMLIGGTALIGLAASGQQSFAFITGEIVPMKLRFAANAVMYIFVIPFSGLGPIVSKALILNTAATWRWCYYLMIILNVLSGLLFALFYFPPTFHEKFRDRHPLQQVKELDFVGMFLFVAGLLVFMLGLSWGGQAYPWKSANVIATMVVGGVTLVAFALWEIYADLKEPLLPMHLFKNFAWVVSCLLLGLGASIFYAMAVIWPSMVAVLYTDDGGASMYAGWLSCVPSAMINLGQIFAGFLAEPIGKTKIQCMVVLTLGGAFLGAVAASTPDTKGLATALLMVGSFFIGWNESVCLSNSGIELLDQREIGTAVGAAGSIRSAISCLASAVYISILNNRLATTIPAVVGPAVEQAGLPASSVPSFLAGFTTGTFDGVPGVNATILAVGNTAYKTANSDAYRTVFFTTIAFTGIAVILSVFSPNVDDKMTGQVAVKLHHAGKSGDATVATDSPV